MKDEGLEGAKRSERENKRARHYAEAIIATVPPLLVLDEKLRVRTANVSLSAGEMVKAIKDFWLMHNTLPQGFRPETRVQGGLRHVHSSSLASAAQPRGANQRKEPQTVTLQCKATYEKNHCVSL